MKGNFNERFPPLIYFERAPRLKASAFNRQLNGSKKETAQIVLEYEHEGNKVKQIVAMVRRHVGASSFWEFVCPKTGKKCKALYFINGTYGHREAFKGIAQYKKCTFSKKQRLMVQGRISPLQLKFKKHKYGGRLTGKVLASLRKIEKARAKRQEYLAKYGKK